MSTKIFYGTILTWAILVSQNAMAGTNCVKADSEGRLVVAGDQSVGYLMRLNQDRTQDLKFKSSWIGSGFNDSVNEIAIQGDGKILVGGDFTEFNGQEVRHLARLNPDGSLDLEFVSNAGRKLNERVHKILILNDGGILIAGSFSRFGEVDAPYYAKLKSNGKWDEDFKFSLEVNAPILSAFYDGQNQIIYLGGGFRDQKGKSHPLIQITESGSPTSALQLNLHP